MTPTISHRRSSPPRRITTTSDKITGHTSRSKVAVLSRWPVASKTAETAIDPAASSCALRSPPRRRVIAAVSGTIAAAATADGSRSTTTDPGARSFISLANSGTNGG